MPVKSAYVLIAPGSRQKENNQPFLDFVRRFAKAHPRRFVKGAFLRPAKPPLEKVLKDCIEKGKREFFILPFPALPSRHVKEDIPLLLQKIRQEHPDIDFHYTGPLAGDKTRIPS